MHRNVTINDVARAAGVSITTVSRILNNKPDVAPETRQRVLDAIEQLGYTPHAQAKNLAAGRSRSLAVHYPSNSMGFSELEFEFFVGVAEVAGKHDFMFNLFFQPMTDNGLLNLYRSNQVDGVILMEIHLNDYRVEALREHGYPFVMIGHCNDNTGLSYIDLDFEASMQLAVEHLYQLGHRHIGILNLTGALREHGYGPAVRFLLGYERVCVHYGLTPISGEATRAIEDTHAVTRRMLEEFPEMTAIVTLHTDASAGIVRAVQGHGLSIPQDFSLISILADRLAKLISPPLTAISFPAYTMGGRAAQMLVRLLQDGAYEPEQVMLAPRLVIRDSTGPAKVRAV